MRSLRFALLLALVPALVSAEVGRSRDLESLLDQAAVVVRAKVVSVSGAATEVDPLVLELAPDAVLKGEAPRLFRAPVEGDRPLRPTVGESALFFLGPSSKQPGALACIQLATERWTLTPEAEGPADLFIEGLMLLRQGNQPRGAVAFYLGGLEQPSERLAAFSAQRLAFWGKRSGLEPEDWARVEAFLANDARPDEVRAGLVAALGEQLSPERALALELRVGPDSRTRAALLLRSGAAAQGIGPAAERARGALAAARSDAPHIALAAAEALAMAGDDAALPALARILAQGDSDSRRRAVLALSELAVRGSRSARAELRGLSGDSDELVRLRAQSALRRAWLHDPGRLERSRAALSLAAVALVLLTIGLMALRVGRARG